MRLEEPFAQGGSVLHRLDPRAKLVAALVYACVVAVLRDARVLAVAVAFSVALLLIARLDARRCARRILVVNVFIAFLWLFVPWSVPGHVVARIGPAHVTREGLLFAARITMRCNAIVLALVALLATSRIADLARALRLLHVPEKLVAVLFFCVRYIQVIHDEYHRLLAAARIRGFKPTVSLHTYRTYANFVGMLLVRSNARGDRIHEAMLCRGFNGRFPSLGQGRVRGRDVAAAVVVVAFAVVLVGLEWMGTVR